jgi:hypothetical protein
MSEARGHSPEVGPTPTPEQDPVPTGPELGATTSGAGTLAAVAAAGGPPGLDTLRPPHVLAAQRTAGNAAIARLIESPRGAGTTPKPPAATESSGNGAAPEALATTAPESSPATTPDSSGTTAPGSSPAATPDAFGGTKSAVGAGDEKAADSLGVTKPAAAAGDEKAADSLGATMPAAAGDEKAAGDKKAGEPAADKKGADSSASRDGGARVDGDAGPGGGARAVAAEAVAAVVPPGAGGGGADGFAGGSADGLVLDAMPAFAAPPPMQLSASDDPGAQEIADALTSAGTEGQQLLSQAAAEGASQIRQSVADEQVKVDDLATSAALQLAAKVRGAKRSVQASLEGARARLAEAELTHRADLAAWQQQATQRAGQEVASRQQRARQLGVTKGDEAVTAANTAANTARDRIEGGAGEARSRGEAAARNAGGEPEVAQAKAGAAREVASNTAAEITKSVGETQAQLRGLGPETRPQFVDQANQFAEGIGRQLPGLTAELGRTAQQATSAMADTAAAGRGSLDACGASVLEGLGSLEASVSAMLREQAATSRKTLATSGGQAVVAIQEQHQAAAQAGADLIATVYGSVGNRKLRRAVASRLSGQLREQVRQGFISTEQQARIASAQVAQSFAQAAVEAHAAIAQTASQGEGQAEQTLEGGRAQLLQQQEAIARQLLTAVTGARTRGDALIADTGRSLDASITDLDTRFAQAVADLRATLDQRTNEAVQKAREPLGSLDKRINDAMRRAEERMNMSWLERQLHDIAEGINWGFIAGLVVGLLVTIAVVALLGTGIGALILAGALAGALSVAASTLTENAIHGRPTDWGKLGKDMLIGAAFGAVGGAIGGGVTGAVGGALQRKLVTEFGAVALAKASNVVAGTVTGVVQNVVNGEPWDRGLLLNVMTNVGMTYGPGARAIDTLAQGARGTAVDTGNAFNVSPAETAASSARFDATAASLPDTTVRLVGGDGPIPAGGDGPIPAGGDGPIPAGGDGPIPAGGDGPIPADATAAPGERTPATGTPEEVAADARAQQERVQEPPALQEQIDQVTGVDKGPQHEQAMRELREFYENQQREAQNVAEVQTSRTDQMVDPATGTPLTNPDGTPYGYGIEGRFDARRFQYEGTNLTEVTIKVHLDAQPGVNPADVQRVQTDTFNGIDQHYNQNRQLPNGDRLHVTIEFVDNPADAQLNVRLEGGQGRADQFNWYVESDPIVHAHELGHQMGLLDEYVDPSTVNRGTPASPGVHTDQSLMGNFWITDAAGNPVPDPGTRLQDRHLQQIGGDVDAARGAAGGGGPGPAPPGPEGAPRAQAPPQPIDPRQIAAEIEGNNGALGRKIGEGGFGAVHEVPGNPDLVVKVPREGTGPNPQLAKEAQSLQLLADEGVPTAFRGEVEWTLPDGTTQRGIVMDKVEGAFSKEVLQQGKFAEATPQALDRAAISDRTVRDLEQLKATCMGRDIDIQDLQFMIDHGTGEIRVIDPARVDDLQASGLSRKRVKERMEQFEKRIDRIIRRVRDIARENRGER